MVWTDGHRFVEAINIVLDQMGRRSYIFWCTATSIQQNQPNQLYLQMLYESDYDELIVGFQQMKNNLTGWATVCDQVMYLLGARKENIDVQCGVWTLDEWFYFYMCLNNLIPLIGYDLSDLKYLRHYYPSILSSDWDDGSGILVE